MNNGSIRIPVTLKPEDNDLLIKLRAIIEARSKKRITVAEIVRMALRELAASHNI
jgi:hypothetical protein